MKTAVVMGATGLVGGHLVKRLAESSQYAQVLAICRKPVQWENPKIRTVLFDFSDWSQLESQIKNYCSFNEIHSFCALGTTIKQAGSQEAFLKVDQVYPVLFGKLSDRLGAEKFLMVSALGASAESNVFYNRVKGQTEQELAKVFHRQLAFCRPSLLLGQRDQFRLGEKIATAVYLLLSPLIKVAFKKYCPIHADQVALAMQKIAENKMSQRVFENQELLQFREN